MTSRHKWVKRYEHGYELHYMSLVMRKPAFANAKTKTQISFAVTAKLISVFVFATRIVQSLYFLNPKFQASGHLRWMYSPVCNGPGLKPRRLVFSERGSYYNVLVILDSYVNVYSPVSVGPPSADAVNVTVGSVTSHGRLLP